MCTSTLTARATNLDTIGVTLLRQVDPTLNGGGVRVAQVEAPYYTTPTPPYAFEVIPSAVGQPATRFTYYSDLGTATTYPNSIGVNSDHATSVGGNFFGNAGAVDLGVATNVTHVDNYEYSYFIDNKIYPTSAAIPAVVVNQSFNFTSPIQSTYETAYDNYVVSHKTSFITGAGNGGPIESNLPATSFNGIAVGVTDGNSSYGPTADGRSKPDITSPGSGATSFSTPHVSGAATILVQAGARNDGGSATSSTATNPITIKALLLNGAIKPADWTNGPVTPLDARYGAGIVNVFNSWKQLKGGLHTSNETNTVTSGNPHPPGASVSNQPSLLGWNHGAISTTATQDKIIHYYFNLTNSNPCTFTATLVWNRQNNQAAINNLDLFLYNAANSNLVLSSISAVDNVEHLFLPQLAPGRYDLQVVKRGSATQVSQSETYALAFEMFCVKLNLAVTNGNLALSWTNSPTGFRLVSAASLNPPAPWATVGNAVVMTNGLNLVSVPITGTNQFFRLQRP